jgi:septum formation protein
MPARRAPVGVPEPLDRLDAPGLLGPIVLASASTRRIELLRLLVPAFEVQPANVEELAEGSAPSAVAIANARAKAAAVRERRPDATVIGADTVVVLDGEILGKPRDAREALSMLSRLSGRGHEVVTGLAVAGPDGVRTGFAATAVHFLPWPPAALAAYAASPEPLDKAGAYAIQGQAGVYVERIEGCWFNVVGLPLARLARLLPAGPRG